jgi:uncharacterized protein
MNKLSRRAFIRAASVASGALACASPAARAAAQGAERHPRLSEADYTPRLDYPIRAARARDVTLRDGFWQPKVATNARVTIPFEVQKSIESERRLSGNVLEAAIRSLEIHPDAALRAQVDNAVEAIRSRPAAGNSGFEAAAAYYHATGRRDLLDRAIEAADVLYKDFALNDPPFSGGERDAINCTQLYLATHDKRHLDLAKHYLDIRGLGNSVNRSRHNQSYEPVLEQSEAVGHAVNCASLMVSLTDVGVLTGIRDYLDAATRLWSDVVNRKMYVTGGIGSTGNEGFGEPFSLPNISAYSETCAVLMFITLNHKLFLASGDSRYIDVMERGMYNNALSGVSTSGARFFYVNRLASAGGGRDERWERASLECCPPNLVRFLASMPGLVYAQGRDGAVYVNLYASSDVSFEIGGRTIALSVNSGMPWDGKTTIRVSARDALPCAIKLRIPGWARNQPVPGALYSYADRADGRTTIAINRTNIGTAPDESGYVTLDRRWANGDVIEIEFPTDVRRVVADRRVAENRGRTAVERGPIVYCAEFPDARAHVIDALFDVTKVSPTLDRTLFGGVTTLRAGARPMSDPTASLRPVTLIPYHLWANRGTGEMAVWLSTAEYAVGDTGPAGGLIFYVNPNHAADGWRYLEAAPVDQSAGAAWGCFRRAISGARGTEIGAGRQNTLDILAACAEPETAARLCATYRLNGVGGWFLPSRDELGALYRGLKAGGAGHVSGGAADNVTYWTSSQQTADMASHIDFADSGRQHFDDKDFPRRVRAIRAF